MLFFFRYHSYRELSNFPHISIPFPFGLAISIDILITICLGRFSLKRIINFVIKIHSGNGGKHPIEVTF